MTEPTVLLLHNRYREPGGEERSVSAIADLLRERGHRVELIERSSAELGGASGRLRAGAAMLAGGVHPEEISAAVRRTGAAVVHAHNIHPLLGHRALAAARAAGARVVMHLHNYRIFCAIAISYRDGDLCDRCRGRNTLPGLLLRCRGSVAEAAVYAAALSAHQGRLDAAVDRFVVPSRAAGERLVHLGMADHRMDVLHNFLPDSDFARESAAGEGRYALYAGRLAEEKGVDTAIAATRAAGVPLVVAGSGPDEPRLRKLAEGADVRFAGRLSPDRLAETRLAAAFAIVPSRWAEPCPYAAIEAMAAGLPVLASDAGGLPEIVGPHEVLPPRAEDRWASAARELWADPRHRERAGRDALARARKLFGADHFYGGLSAVYRFASLA